MQSWGVWGERVTPAYARDVGAFLEGEAREPPGLRRARRGSADLIKGDRGSARGHVMNSFVAPPFGKTLADFAGAAAMRAKISPEAAAVHDRSKEHQASFRGGAFGEKQRLRRRGLRRRDARAGRQRHVRARTSKNSRRCRRRPARPR